MEIGTEKKDCRIAWVWADIVMVVGSKIRIKIWKI